MHTAYGYTQDVPPRGYKAKETKPVSFKLTPNAIEMLAKLAVKNGVNKTAFLETLIRDTARKQSIKTDEKPID